MSMEPESGEASGTERSALAQLHAGVDLVDAFIEQAAFFEKVWQYSADAMFVLRRRAGALLLEAVNPAAERRFGHSGSALIGRPITELLPSDLAAELERHCDLALSAPLRPTCFETPGIDRKRRSCWSVLLVPVFGVQEEPRFYGIARDITQLRRASEALRRGRRALARRLVERTRELHELATRDSLTHAYNRRHFFELAARHCALARRHGEPLSAIMLDVDHFKRINDEFGHAVGDRALERVADCCRAILRASDIFGRYGGEEFAIVLPETGFDNALNVAEKIRRGVAAMEIGTDQHGPVQLTVSMGIASCNAENADIRTVLNHADQALLRAKREGRNRVEAYREG